MNKKRSEEVHPDVAHMAKALLHAIQYSGTSRHKIEKALGYSRGYVSKILNGTVELRSRHVFEILGLIDMQPWKFFQLAFPPPGAESPSQANAELDEKIREGLLRVLMGTRS
jgi:transcriptional regulator with XRE-family HTH domain